MAKYTAQNKFDKEKTSFIGFKVNYSASQLTSSSLWFIINNSTESTYNIIDIKERSANILAKRKMTKKIITILFTFTIIFSLSTSSAFALSNTTIIKRVQAMNVSITSAKYDKTTNILTVQYNKSDSGIKVDGYMVYSSTNNSDFKKISTTTSKKITIKKLTAGKTYYFRIKAYRTVNGKKYYTQYSKKVKVSVPSAKTTDVVDIASGTNNDDSKINTETVKNEDAKDTSSDTSKNASDSTTTYTKKTSYKSYEFDPDNGTKSCSGRTEAQAKQYVKDWYNTLGQMDMAWYKELLPEDVWDDFVKDVEYLINNPKTSSIMWKSITGGDDASLIATAVGEIAIEYGL